MSTAVFVAHYDMQKKALKDYREAKLRYEENPNIDNLNILEESRKKCILLSVRGVEKGYE